MAYLGQGAEGNFTTTNAKDTFSGDGSETTFTLSQRGTENNVDVFVNNVRQEPGVAYNIEGNGTSLVFTAAPSTGTNNIYVVNRGPAELSASHPASQNLEAADGTFTGNLTVNRASTDGTIVDLQKDGTTIGSIGVDYSSRLYIGTGDTGLFFNDVSDAVQAISPEGNLRSNAIDLGTAGTTFKDLYLGGGMYVGGTGSANKLDDYEEGTWTPTYSGSTTNPTVSYTEQHGEYVKIGRQVIARLELKTSSFSGGSGIVTVGGLPFTTTSNDGARSGNLIVGYSQGFASTTHAPQTGYANQNATSIVLGHRASDTGANAELSGTFAMSNLSSSGNNFLMATLIYTAA